MGKVLTVSGIVLSLAGLPALAADESKAMVKKLEASMYKQALYTKCVADSIELFKSSKETADVIADGAIGNCQGSRSAWLGSIPAPLGGDSTAMESLAESQDAKLKQWAISLILRYRSEAESTQTSHRSD